MSFDNDTSFGMVRLHYQVFKLANLASTAGLEMTSTERYLSFLCLLFPLFRLFVLVHSGFERSNRFVGFFAMLIGFEFQPRPVRDLVCEDGEDEDFADRAGEGFVELSC